MTTRVVGMVTLFNAVDDAVNDIDSSLALEAKNVKPTPVTEGESFTHDGYGWPLAGRCSEQYGGVTIRRLKVTNV